MRRRDFCAIIDDSREKWCIEMTLGVRNRVLQGLINLDASVRKREPNQKAKK